MIKKMELSNEALLMSDGERKERSSLFNTHSVSVRELERDIELLRRNVDKCDAAMTMELIRRIEKNPTIKIDDSVTVSMMIQRFKLNCKCERQT